MVRSTLHSRPANSSCPSATSGHTGCVRVCAACLGVHVLATTSVHGRDLRWNQQQPAHAVVPFRCCAHHVAQVLRQDEWRVVPAALLCACVWQAPRSPNSQATPQHTLSLCGRPCLAGERSAPAALLCARVVRGRHAPQPARHQCGHGACLTSSHLSVHSVCVCMCVCVCACVRA